MKKIILILIPLFFLFSCEEKNVKQETIPIIFESGNANEFSVGFETTTSYWYNDCWVIFRIDQGTKENIDSLKTFRFNQCQETILTLKKINESEK